MEKFYYKGKDVTSSDSVLCIGFIKQEHLWILINLVEW